MPDFNYDVVVISAFKPCGALQMFKAYERNLQDLTFLVIERAFRTCISTSTILVSLIDKKGSRIIAFIILFTYENLETS